jgi:hypothetical protein
MSSTPRSRREPLLFDTTKIAEWESQLEYDGYDGDRLCRASLAVRYVVVNVQFLMATMGGRPQLPAPLQEKQDLNFLEALWERLKLAQRLMNDRGVEFTRTRDLRVFRWRKRYWESAHHAALGLAEEKWLGLCSIAGTCDYASLPKGGQPLLTPFDHEAFRRARKRLRQDIATWDSDWPAFDKALAAMHLEMAVFDFDDDPQAPGPKAKRRVPKRFREYVLKAIGDEKLTGEEISRKAGYCYDYTRKFLPTMVAEGSLDKTGDGYIRGKLSVTM